MASGALPDRDHRSQGASLLELEEDSELPRGVKIGVDVLMIALVLGLVTLWLHPLARPDDSLHNHSSQTVISLPVFPPLAIDVRTPLPPGIEPAAASSQPREITLVTNDAVQAAQGVDGDNTDR